MKRFYIIKKRFSIMTIQAPAVFNRYVNYFIVSDINFIDEIRCVLGLSELVSIRG